MDRQEQLLKAAEKGDISHVRFLIKMGCDFHFDDEAPLRAAIASNSTAVVNFLLDLGAKMPANSST